MSKKEPKTQEILIDLKFENEKVSRLSIQEMLKVSFEDAARNHKK